MTFTAASEVLDLLKTTLETDNEITVVQGATVTDDPLPDSGFPSVNIGEHQEVQNNTHDPIGRDVFVSLHIWTDRTVDAGPTRLLAIVNRIIELFECKDLTTTNWNLSVIYEDLNVFNDTSDENQPLMHGVLDLKFMALKKP